MEPKFYNFGFEDAEMSVNADQTGIFGITFFATCLFNLIARHPKRVAFSNATQGKLNAGPRQTWECGRFSNKDVVFITFFP